MIYNGELFSPDLPHRGLPSTTTLIRLTVIFMSPFVFVTLRTENDLAFNCLGGLWFLYRMRSRL